MAETLRDFFSPEAGQRRRSWLNSIDDKVSETLGYYLGPQLAPRVEQAANIGALFSPGMDVQDAYTASGEMMAPGRSALDRAGAGAALAGSVAAMFMPGGVSSIRQGIDDLAEAGARGARSPTLGSNAGNLAADAAAETPAQQVARLLREGRGAEVTDELYAQADPQELSRLYDAGATGMDMPMGPAALERADEMGLIDDQYHATLSDFPAFMPSQTGLVGRGVYSGDFASDVADYARADGVDGLNVMPIRTPSGDNYASRIVWQNTVDADQDFPWNATVDETVQGFKRAAETMTARGFSGVHSQPGERVTFDPRNIRSRFARFDPRLSHLANLNAGFAGAGVLGAGALAMQPGEAQAQPASVGDILWQQEQAKRLRDYLEAVQ